MSIIGGQFIPRAIVSHDETNYDSFLINNGITDTALQHQFDTSGPDSLTLLDKLSPSQLKETTIGYSLGGGVTTYGDEKTFLTLQTQLNQWVAQFAAEGTGIGTNDDDFRNANEGDRQVVEVGHFLGELGTHQSGAVTDVEAALSQLNTNGQLAEISNQAALSLDVTDTKNWLANQAEGWKRTDGSSLAEVIDSPATAPQAADPSAALERALRQPDVFA